MTLAPAGTCVVVVTYAPVAVGPGAGTLGVSYNDGVGPQTAATLLVVAGDNPTQLHSEAALAALCGTSPLQASSGKV